MTKINPRITPAAEVDRRAAELLDEGKAKTYAEAMQLVFKADPNLRDLYEAATGSGQSAGTRHVGEDLDEAVQEYMDQHEGVTYSQALHIVSKENPAMTKRAFPAKEQK